MDTGRVPGCCGLAGWFGLRLSEVTVSEVNVITMYWSPGYVWALTHLFINADWLTVSLFYATMYC